MSELPEDAYPVLRVSVEYFMRGIDLLGQLQGDNLIRGMIFAAIWNANRVTGIESQKAIESPDGARRPVSVRELSRIVNMPYETVRRHVQPLLRERQCVKTEDGFIVPQTVLSRGPTAKVLRKCYANTIRLLNDLERIGFVTCPAETGRLDRDDDDGLSDVAYAIVNVGNEVLLRAVKTMGEFWDGDIIKGLVFNAIWTANIKHITNASDVALRAVISDRDRKPVSVLAIANSLRLPYETTRRHANALVRQRVCMRISGQGLIVPAEYHRGAADMTTAVYNLVVDFITSLQQVGIEIERV